MGANEDFKRLAKEMAEKARAQREKAAKAAQAPESTDNDARRETPDEARKDARSTSDKK